MTVIGQGVIEVVADATKLKAGISDSKTALQSLRDVAKNVGETLNAQSVAYIRSLEKQAATIERQALAFGKSKSEIAAYRAEQLGIGQTAAVLVSRLEAGEKSLLAQADAAREAAAATAKLGEQQRLLESIGTKSRPPVSPIDTVAQRGLDLGIDPSKLDPLIAQWRAVEAAASEAAIAEKAAADAASFLASLQTRVQTTGKSPTELLELKAAQMGVSQSAEPMIAQLRAIEAQTMRTAEAEREAAIATARMAEQQHLLDTIAVRARPAVSPIDAAAQKGAALGIDPAVLDPLIAQWRAVEIAATQAAKAEKEAAEAAAFLGSLQTRVQTTGKGSTELLELKAAQLGVAQSAEPMIAELKAIEAQAIQTAAAERKAAEAASFLASLKGNADAVGKTRSELLQMKAAELGVANEAKGFIAQIGSATGHTEKLSFATAAAKRELLVLVHELSQGNYKNFAGSLLVLGERTGAASLLFSGFSLAVLGALGALGAFATAAYIGASESKALADALALTGNYAGQTAGSFNAMAKAIAASGQISISSAREFGLALIKTGEIGPANLARATEAAARYGEATDKTAKEVAQDFAAMSQGIAKWAAEHNRSLNFISSSQYQLIRSLEEEGKAADAEGVVYDALNARLRKLEPNLGTLDRALRATADSWHWFWDKAFDIGRTETIDDKIKAAKEKLEILNTGGSIPVTRDIRSRLSTVPTEATRNALRSADELDLQSKEAQGIEERKIAAAAARQASIDKKAIDADPFVQGMLKRSKSVDAMNKELAIWDQRFKDLAEGGTPVSPRNQAEIRAQVRLDFKPNDELARKAAKEAKAQLALDLEDIKIDSDKVLNAFANGEKIMEAMRAAGLVDEGQYYAAKRGFLIANEVEEERKLQADIDRMDQEELTGKDELELDRKIEEAEAKLAARREASKAELAALDIAEASRLLKLTQGYRDAEDAALAYLDGVRRANTETLAGVGVGNQERERVGGRAQIEDRFSDQLRALEKTRRDAQANKTFGPDAQAKYNDELARIQRFQAASLSEYDTYYATLLAKQQDANVGASEALRNYADDAQKTAKLVEDAFTNAFNGIEDALVDLLKTGKLNLKSLTDAIYSDFAHIVIKQGVTGPLAAAAQDLFSSAKKTAAPDLSANNVNLFAGATGGAAAGVAPTIDTTAVSASLASLQALGIDPTALALQRLQLAANGAASSLGLAGGAGPMPVGGGLVGQYAGTSSDPTAPNYENSLDQSSSAATATTGEQSIANLFKPLQAAQADSAKSADAFGKSAAASASDLALLANAASRGSGAMALLPSIVQAIAAASTTSGGSSGGGGGLFSTLASAVIGAFSGGSPTADSGSVNLFASESPARYSGVSGARALGGPVSGNSLYQVNERGPELLEVAGKQYLMTGAQGGNVTANADTGRGAEQRPVSVTNNFVLATPASQATQAQVAARAGHGIARAMRRGN
jgi:lambda family phage tail tape measure protein